jgi:hypothetical protein
VDQPILGEAELRTLCRNAGNFFLILSKMKPAKAHLPPNGATTLSRTTKNIPEQNTELKISPLAITYPIKN